MNPIVSLSPWVALGSPPFSLGAKAAGTAVVILLDLARTDPAQNVTCIYAKYSCASRGDVMWYTKVCIGQSAICTPETRASTATSVNSECMSQKLNEAREARYSYT